MFSEGFGSIPTTNNVSGVQQGLAQHWMFRFFLALVKDSGVLGHGQVSGFRMKACGGGSGDLSHENVKVSNAPEDPFRKRGVFYFVPMYILSNPNL